MQSTLCSRPFAVQAVARAPAQAARVGLAPPAHRHQWQRSQQQGVALSASASSSICGCSCSSFAGAVLPASPLLERQTSSGSGPSREVTRMGNKGATGPFAPLVRAVREVVGKKEFNKLRGKAISLHSQVIKDFTQKYLGASTQQAQGLIRIAKKNGERLGFLA